MANSKYEYVRDFERDELLLPNTWIVVRIDGRGFHKLSNYYAFAKPNDARALKLMNAAATHALQSIPEIVVAYGVSDEFSFVFHKSTQLFERRSAKIVSTVVSTFTAAYVALWPEEMGGEEGRKALSLSMLPSFDGRAVCYPAWENLRDYLSWRQVDCHINNLYNTTFWALVQQGGMTHTAAEEHLKGSVAADKNEILFSRFGINYNNEPEMYRKGSVLYRDYELEDVPGKEGAGTDKDGDERGDGTDVGKQVKTGGFRDVWKGEEIESGVEQRGMSKTQREKMRKARIKAKVVAKHLDIIKDDFWTQRPWIRSGKVGRAVEGKETP